MTRVDPKQIDALVAANRESLNRRARRETGKNQNTGETRGNRQRIRHH